MPKKKTATDAPVEVPPYAAPRDTRAELRQLQTEIRDLEARRARRAVERARDWTALLEWLEDLLAFGDPDLRGVADMLAPKSGADPSPGRLWSAIIHAPMMRDFDRRDVVALEWLDKMVGGRFDPVDDFLLDAKPGELLARAIGTVQRLLDHDLAEARRAAFRAPGDLESGVLRVLVDADHGLSAKEIARALDKRHLVADEGAVQDAIGRLRHDCGFEIPNNRTGYVLTDTDRDHARGFEIARTNSE